MKTAKFTNSQIMSILKKAESDTSVAALCLEHGMSPCVAVLLRHYNQERPPQANKKVFSRVC